MSSDYIEPYMDGFYNQRAFRRVYERVKQTSNEKVMIVRSWNSRAHSLLSSARRAPPRRSTQPHTAHAESSAQVVSSCRRAHAAQHKRSDHEAHAKELSTGDQLVQLMQKSSAKEVSSCRRAHAAQHKRSTLRHHLQEDVITNLEL